MNVVAWPYDYLRLNDVVFGKRFLGGNLSFVSCAALLDCGRREKVEWSYVTRVFNLVCGCGGALQRFGQRGPSLMPIINCNSRLLE
jgi:hypothetical protein